MYDEELEFFIARFRQTNSARWPYLRYAVNEMYNKYYQRNRTRPDSPPEEGDSEWVNIEDDHDDEITFRANANPDEIVPNNQLDDTLLYEPSLRQQDECQDPKTVEGDNLQDEYGTYDADYQTLDPPTQFDDMFYTIDDAWTDNLN